MSIQADIIQEIESAISADRYCPADVLRWLKVLANRVQDGERRAFEAARDEDLELGSVIRREYDTYEDFANRLGVHHD